MAYGLTHRNSADDLAHGVGKRWDGTRYTCTQCRRWPWTHATSFLETFVARADELAAEVWAKYASAAPRLLSLNDIPLIGAFPAPRIRRAMREAEEMRQRRRRWYGV